MDLLRTISRLQSLIECPVCLEPLKEPKLLVCGHRFCKHCLEKIQHYNTICCPLCKVLTSKCVEQLPKDCMVENIKNNVDHMADIVTNKHCAVCLVDDASVRCFDCQVSMCDTCNKRHTVKYSTDHVVVELDPSLICELHGKDLTHVCVDCSRAICSCCLLQDCGDHDSMQVKDGLKTYFEIQQQTTEDTLYIQQNSQMLQQKLLETFEKTVLDIQNHSDKIIQSIKKETCILINKVNQLKSESIKIIELTELAANRLSENRDIKLEQCRQKIPPGLFHSLADILRPEFQESKDYYLLKGLRFLGNRDIGLGRVYLDLSSNTVLSPSQDIPTILFGCQNISGTKLIYKELPNGAAEFTCAIDTKKEMGLFNHKTITGLFGECKPKRSMIGSLLDN